MINGRPSLGSGTNQDVTLRLPPEGSPLLPLVCLSCVEAPKLGLAELNCPQARVDRGGRSGGLEGGWRWGEAPELGLAKVGPSPSSG